MIDLKNKHWLSKLKCDMYSGRRSPGSVFSEIKNESNSYFISEKLAPQAERNSVIRKYLYGTPLPSNYKNIRHAPQLNFSNDLRTELNWCALSLSKFRREVNSFIEARGRFTELYLLGNFAGAWTILDEIESKICYSLWSLENRLLISEKLGGFERNAEFLSTVNKQKLSPFVSSLADWFSKRAESGISAQKFEQDLNDYLKEIAIQSPHSAEYLRLKLAMYSESQPLPDSLAHIVYFEHRSSVVDRYITFLTVGQLSQVSGAMAPEISKIIKYVSGFLEAPELKQLALLSDIDKRIVISDALDETIRISDDYTKGNYNEVISASKIALRAYPNNFEFCQFYSKSLALSGGPVLHGLPPGSPLGETLNGMESILKKEGEIDTAFEKLHKISQSMGISTWSIQLRGFLIEEGDTTPSVDKKGMSTINTTIANPDLGLLLDANNRAIFFEKLGIAFESSETIKFLSWYYQCIDSKVVSSYQGSVPKFRRLRYEAKARARLGDSVGGRNLLIELKDEYLGSEHTLPSYLAEDIYLNIFDSYLSNNQAEEAINIAAEAYFTRNAYIARMKLAWLSDIIDKIDISKLNQAIDLPIIIEQSQRQTDIYNDYRVYIAYRHFLKTLNVRKPTDIRDLNQEVDRGRLVSFLRDVCRTDILKHHFVYPTLTDAQNGRISICQWLLDLDPDSSDAYFAEINLLTQDIFKRNGLQHIGKVKIHVHTIGLSLEIEDDIEQEFRRYKALGSLESVDLHFFDAAHSYTQVVKDIEGSDEEKSSEHINESGKKFLIFKDMFLKIRDKFSTSKFYGLDSYLSSNVRHGFLVTHLRKEFESEKIITSRASDESSYLKDDFWCKHLSLLPPECDFVSERLIELSKHVDHIAYELNNELIQISTERAPSRGLFDFSFSNEELQSLYEGKLGASSDSKAFIKEAFEELWRRTELCLTRTRAHIGDQVKSQLLDRLLEFQENIEKSVSNPRVSEIINAIANCRTKLLHELEVVCSWFKIQNPDKFPDYPISLLNETIVEMVKNMYPNKSISVNHSFTTGCILVGDSYPNLVEACRILVMNAVANGVYSDGHLAVNLETSCQNGTFQMTVGNHLEDINIAEAVAASLKEKSNRIRQQGVGEEVKIEGNSGYQKLHKFIGYDLSSRHYEVEFSNDTSELLVTISIDGEGLIKCGY